MLKGSSQHPCQIWGWQCDAFDGYYLNTFDRIRGWGLPPPDCCLLCEKDDESPAHLFLQCPIRLDVWQRVQLALGDPFDASNEDSTHIENVLEQIKGIVKGSLLWRLLWWTILAMVWQICRELNRRWHAEAWTMVAMVANNLIAYLKITFTEKRFKASHHSWSEARSWATSISHNALDWPEESCNMFMSNGSLTINEG